MARPSRSRPTRPPPAGSPTAGPRSEHCKEAHELADRSDLDPAAGRVRARQRGGLAGAPRVERSALMGWLLRNNWPWSLLAFLLGAVITWFLLVRREPPAQAVAQPVEENEEVLVGAAVSRTAEHPPAAAVEVHAVPPAARVVPEEPRPTFSRRMEAERVETPTLFDDAPDEGLDEAPAGTGGPSDTEPQVRADVPPGRYGEGSADAVPHQGPPDGFTIKGNAQ